MVTFGKVKLCFVGCRKFGMVSCQLRAMEPERLAAEVPGGIVDIQLTPAFLPYLGILVRKDHKASALIAGLIQVGCFFYYLGWEVVK